jgi:hypothetical protein
VTGKLRFPAGLRKFFHPHSTSECKRGDLMSLLRRSTRFGIQLVSTSFLVVTFLFASVARAENWLNEIDGDSVSIGERTNVNIMVGNRLLNSKDWNPVDKQPEIGIDADYDGGLWPYSICGSLLLSEATGSTRGVDVSVRILELQLGGRKVWMPIKQLQPYAGGGGSALVLESAVEGGGTTIGSESTYGFGFWVGAGARVMLGKSWQVGVDTRLSRVNVAFGRTRANGGGLHIGVIAGYHWAE